MSHQDQKAGDGGKNQVCKGQCSVSSTAPCLPYGGIHKGRFALTNVLLEPFWVCGGSPVMLVELLEG